MANMKLESIFASKLYQTSDRKEEIKTAMQNPLNKGLVQQLSDYLDEPVEEKEEQSKEKSNIKKVSKQSKNTENESDVEEIPTRTSSMNITHSQKPSNPDMSMEEDIPTPPEAEEPISNESENSVEEATCVEESECDGKNKDKKINSNVKASMCCVPNFSIDTLVGTLRSNNTTSMVDRARIKEDKELWIFYNDSVNLNDIMNDVIELINSAGYSHLEFNRLARSDNAIVFEFTPESLEMQPEETDDSDKIEIEGVEIGEKAEE